MASVVAFLENGMSPKFKHQNFVIGKTTIQISKALPIHDDQILAIKTPSYIEILKNDSIPTNDYPQLIQTLTNPDPQSLSRDYAFQILSNKSKKKFYMIFNVVTENNIIMPEFTVEMKTKKFSEKSVEDFLNFLVEQFGMEISNPKILIDNEEAPLDKPFDYIFQKIRTTKPLFSCKLEQEALKMINLRSKILEELYNSEAIYNFNLNTLYHYFKPKIEEYKLLDHQKIEIIFGNLPKMINCHANFLSSLQKNGLTYASILSETFMSFSFNFMASQQYIVDYDKTIELAGKLKQEQGKKLAEIVAGNPSKTGVDFSGYLIMPIQRMPRYILLIRELIKYTPSSHPDSLTLPKAQHTIEKITHEMETAGEKFDARQQVTDIENRLLRKIKLTTKDRVLVSSSIVNILLQRKSRGNIYLFNDAILITKGVETEVKKMFSNLLETSFLPYTTEKVISFQDSHKWFEIEFQNEELKNNWIESFIQARNPLFREHKESTINSQEVLTCPLPFMFDLSCTCLGDIVYFAGGFCKGGKSVTSLITYNVSTKEAFYDKTIKISCSSSAMSVYNGEIYIFGGQPSIMSVLDNNKWKKLAKAPKDLTREFHTMIQYKNLFIIFGGLCRKKDNVCNTLIYYDIDENNLAKVKPNSDLKPQPRKNHSAVLYKGHMIIHGGDDGKIPFDDIWVYNLSTSMWYQVEMKTKLPARTMHSAILVNKYMIIIGGFNSSKETLPNLSINLDTWDVSTLSFQGNFNKGLARFAATYIPKTKEIICYGGLDHKYSNPSNCIYSLKLPSKFFDTAAIPQPGSLNFPIKIQENVQSEDSTSTSQTNSISNLPQPLFQINEIQNVSLKPINKIERSTAPVSVNKLPANPGKLNSTPYSYSIDNRYKPPPFSQRSSSSSNEKPQDSCIDSASSNFHQNLKRIAATTSSYSTSTSSSTKQPINTTPLPKTSPKPSLPQKQIKPISVPHTSTQPKSPPSVTNQAAIPSIQPKMQQKPITLPASQYKTIGPSSLRPLINNNNNNNPKPEGYIITSNSPSQASFKDKISLYNRKNPT